MIIKKIINKLMNSNNKNDMKEGTVKFFNNSKELIELVNSSADLDNGSYMHEIAERRYTWKIVKDQYFSLFK